MYRTATKIFDFVKYPTQDTIVQLNLSQYYYLHCSHNIVRHSDINILKLIIIIITLVRLGFTGHRVTILHHELQGRGDTGNTLRYLKLITNVRYQD